MGDTARIDTRVWQQPEYRIVSYLIVIWTQESKSRLHIVRITDILNICCHI